MSTCPVARPGPRRSWRGSSSSRRRSRGKTFARSGISVTSSQPEAEAPEQEQETVEAPHPLTEFANSVAEAVGGEAVITFDTVKVSVPADRWAQALTTARDEFGLVLFSFLSAIDWSNETAVGDPLEQPLEEEYIELICTVSDVSEGKRV